MTLTLSPSVAICALAGTSIPSASVLGDYGELWTINNGHAIYDLKPDMIIAMDDLQRDVDTHPDYVEAITGAGVPVLSTGPWVRWPSVEAFPLQEVCDFLTPFYPEPWRILDNTCNYAFALALTRGYEQIGVYGFDWCMPYKILPPQHHDTPTPAGAGHRGISFPSGPRHGLEQNRGF
jgi:hypothetical protein